VIGKPTVDGNTTAAVFTPSDKETEVLTKIIILDIARIRYYLKDLRSTDRITETCPLQTSAKDCTTYTSGPFFIGCAICHGYHVVAILDDSVTLCIVVLQIECRDIR
jgi:hypothetical protein